LLVIAGLVVIVKLLPNRAMAPGLGPRESIIGSGAFLLGTWILLRMLKGDPRFLKANISRFHNGAADRPDMSSCAEGAPFQAAAD